MVAVANAVKMVGAKPVYCDCAEGQHSSLNPSCSELLEKATPLTKVVIVCHTYGVACKDIKAGFAQKRNPPCHGNQGRGQPVCACFFRAVSFLAQIDNCFPPDTACVARLEDGSLVGTFGDFGITSLYANKQITAGDGGWVQIA
eukprot:2461537-Amphidinium_carterae.2